MDVLEFVRILREKQRVAAVLTGIGVLVGILAYFVLPPIYESRVTFMVLESKLIRRNLEGRKLDIDTYLDFVNNESIYRDIYDRLEIGKNYDLNFEQFKKVFEVTSVEDTAIINLIVSFEDPAVCRNIAEMVAKQALELNRSVIQQEIRAGHQFSELQVQQASDKLEQAREALDQFLKDNPVHRMALELDNLRNRITLEKTGGMTVYPPVESASNLPTPTPIWFSSFSSSDSDGETLVQLQGQRDRLAAELANAHSDNRKLSLRAQLKTLDDRIGKRKQQLLQLTEQLTRMEARYYPLKHQYAKLSSEFNAAQKGYEEVYRTAVETKMEVAGKTKEMTVIDPPVQPDQPIFPKLIFTLIGGLFLGILSVFLYVILVGFNRKLDNA